MVSRFLQIFILLGILLSYGFKKFEVFLSKKKKGLKCCSPWYGVVAAVVLLGSSSKK